MRYTGDCSFATSPPFMHGPTPPMEIRVTLAQLRRATFVRLEVALDDDFLRHLQLALPAYRAGYSQWTGALGGDFPPAFIRWHWYYDEEQRRYVVPFQGFRSNIGLISDVDGGELGPQALYRAALRRLRRYTGWQPPIRPPSRRAQAAPKSALLSAYLGRQPAIAPRPAHSDGSDAWGRKIVRELAQLPEAEQFGQVAKLARVKFGFDQTIALARSPIDPADFAMDGNLPPAWSDLYAAKGLASLDPRLLIEPGAVVWDARRWRGRNPGFWDLSSQYGVSSGWAMASDDGLAVLVLSRPTADAADSMPLIEPNLRALARFAHQMMARQLRAEDIAQGQGAAALTRRHITLLSQFGSGRPRKQLPDLLHISQATVDRQIKQIKQALGVETIEDAIAQARQLGILPD